MGKKRTREEDHEDPISKRITKLHIRHSPSAPNEVQSPDVRPSAVAGSGAPMNGSPKSIAPSLDRIESSPHSYSNNNRSSSDLPYSPQLNREENPYYYSINEQLYYCHQARLSRFTLQQD